MTTDTANLKIELIIASVRPDRFGHIVAAWMRDRVEQHPGVDLHVADLVDFDLPVGLDGSGDTKRWAAHVDEADAFVLVTPEYNHGYPGNLKIAIDALLNEWKAKALSFVSYGGLAGGMRSVEQLRPVFAELQVVTTREAVAFPNVWDTFDEHGHLVNPQRYESTATNTLDQLVWWGRALRAARQTPAR